ncbi:similar to Saccharomyces cerevisiae YHR191C CTF8 Subunit of a complex with Ctf18p that shares some subunits with Replication Factor C and is required for sister chromatid cohesion [Maudiozyma barnettii]|uniref:Similar to Saccharomyces cerevisiae YHR191C CTF8 Subunit of a complex with Ctf18p that shares some subunits with Replication Factor C and is required for sister chromatid cohesion n=1 Tax=Maudiozyma barnettii TaxID=61262 RepID=A0A8H2ZHE0_9SACH|nr:Ctf8p [Kazachstania barnettii]CAB4254417.1 similar to Saccharomyces cerevisiae YHR191C CTF8 Subunit of a complex with Ctf18p that shares some subunits with Replication Factor C and is required for sister chromatid cohesion [Kazachstania barnettii]CAD1782345.1 similar to Saccharomyces cerevisiae YHR191C CTF8 Subunit of a complex with Ctf18p that shares some subunits with Replication Factor C and is required for sister chromatid cohesion [Kazachstania barnettii]
MPSTTISTEQITQLLDPEQKKVTVPTAFGNMILEIQGDLDIPDIDLTQEQISALNIDAQFNTYKGKNVIRFGLLNISEDKKNATLYIGKKQRLLGIIEELETPLGLLKFNSQDGQVDLCDIIRYKVLFKERPLPIM